MSENRETRRSSISKADSYEAIGEFWDTHSSADYWDQGRDIDAVQVFRMTGLLDVDNSKVSLYLSSKITGQEVVGGTLTLRLSDGERYEIPLPMLGHFRAPFAPTADAALLILERAPAVKSVDVTADALVVTFADGRVLSAPLDWFPRLWHGTPAERQAVEVWGETGLHWEALDEDIDAVQLFRMTGPSAEREASIQRWLAQRDAQQANSGEGVETIQLAEKDEKYAAE